MTTKFRQRPRRSAVFAISVSTLVLVAALAGPVSAAPGNRGSVKVHDATAGEELTSPGDKRNEPKVCDFTLHFFGGNPDESGRWWVEAWPRTDGDAPADSGTYVTDEDGNGDSAQTDRLPDGHYKLFWETIDGHTKHKVFKVDCSDAPPGGGGGGEG